MISGRCRVFTGRCILRRGSFHRLPGPHRSLHPGSLLWATQEATGPGLAQPSGPAGPQLFYEDCLPITLVERGLRSPALSSCSDCGGGQLLGHLADTPACGP